MRLFGIFGMVRPIIRDQIYVWKLVKYGESFRVLNGFLTQEYYTVTSVYVDRKVLIIKEG